MRSLMVSISGFRFWIVFGVAFGLTVSLLPSKVQMPSLAASSSSNAIKPVGAGMMAVKAKVAAVGPNPMLLQQQLNTLDVSAAQGHVGIGVLDLNTGEAWFRNGKQRFPMQSVFKLPVGIVVLKLVDAGKLSLDQLVTISRPEFAPGYSPILKEIRGNSDQFTVRNLLEHSVGMSDNTAADALVRLVGGPKRVMAILQAMNIRDIRVDRLEQQLQPDCVGMINFHPELADEQKYAAAVEQIPAAVKKAALERYLTDPRDTATPEGMLTC